MFAVEAPARRDPVRPQPRARAVVGGPGGARSPSSRHEPRHPLRVWAIVAVLAAAMIVAVGGITSVLLAGPWLSTTITAVLITLGAAAMTRVVWAWRWLPSIVGLVLLVAFIVAVFAREYALLGVVPTPEAVDTLLRLGADGVHSITEQVVPAESVPGIELLIVAGVGAAALLADAAVFALRTPALAAVPLLAVLSVPAVVATGSGSLSAFIGTALLWLALLWLHGRRLRVGQAIGLAAAVTVATLVTGPLVAGVQFTDAQGTGSGPGGLAMGVNPLIDLGTDLRRGEPVTALQYTTTRLGGDYLRLMTLDRIDGLEWVPTESDPAQRSDATTIPGPDGVAEAVTVERVTTQVRIGALVGRWLPVPTAPRLIDGLEGDWQWDDGAQAVRSRSAATGGQSYTVVSERVRPTADQLRAAGSLVPPPLLPQLELAEQSGDIPELLLTETRRVTAGLATSYEKAIALQRHLRDGMFLYSEDTPVSEGYDGSGLEAVTAFLEQRSGYCVHFASAMAVMARVAGIPARVAVGFLPGLGSFDEVSATTTYSVRSTDLHAWPELYFEGIGWVAFEPTPGRGIATNFDGIDPLASAADQSFLDGFDVPAPEVAPAQVGPEVESTRGADASTTAEIAPVVWVLLVIAALLLVASAPGVWREVIRLRRVRSGDPELAWREVVATALDHGITATDAETVRSLAARLAALEAMPREHLDAVSALTEANAYGRHAGTVSGSPRDTRAVVRGIAASHDLRERWRARWLPPSLARRSPLRRLRAPHRRR